MTALALTESMQELLRKAVGRSSPVLTASERSVVEESIENDALLTKNIFVLKKCIDHENNHRLPGDKMSLSQCIRGSRVSLVAATKKEQQTREALRSNEQALLLKRREYLQLEREKREYNRMVFGQEEMPQMPQEESVSESFGAQYRSFNNQISIIMNMIVAMFVSFGIAYFIASKYVEHQSQKMIAGLGGATVMLLVEMLLFILRSVRVEREIEGGCSSTLEGQGNKEQRQRHHRHHHHQQIGSSPISSVPILSTGDDKTDTD